MTTTELTQNQKEVFAKACARRGLHPEGFDVRALGDGHLPSHTVVLVGGREYRYPYIANDDTWAETFFHDLNKEGDSGDGVETATSEEERRSTAN